MNGLFGISMNLIMYVLLGLLAFSLGSVAMWQYEIGSCSSWASATSRVAGPRPR